MLDISVPIPIVQTILQYYLAKKWFDKRTTSTDIPSLAWNSDSKSTVYLDRNFSDATSFASKEKMGIVSIYCSF